MEAMVVLCTPEPNGGPIIMAPMQLPAEPMETLISMPFAGSGGGGGWMVKVVPVVVPSKLPQVASTIGADIFADGGEAIMLEA